MHVRTTVGTEEYDNGRRGLFYDLDAVILCYSVMNSATLDNIVNKHWPNMQSWAPSAFFLLVGLQIDCRDNEEMVAKHANQMVSTAQGQDIAQQLGIPVQL